MKRLVLPALLCLAASGCVSSRAAVVETQEEAQAEAGKCELVQTLMREPLPQRYLAQFAAEGRDAPAQVLVFVRRPEQGLLERLFVGDEPSCGGFNYKVVQQMTQEAVVLFLQPSADGYDFDVQHAAPDELSLGGEAKGQVSKRGGGWAASSH